jgi:chemotaxis response regulator CheB
LNLRKSSLTSRERLQRPRQASRSGIANLIVIGASAGGHRALVEILKNFSDDMPAAIVILLHMGFASPPNLKEFLGRFSRLPIIALENQEGLEHGFIFVPPPGRSAASSCGTITV